MKKSNVFIGLLFSCIFLSQGCFASSFEYWGAMHRRSQETEATMAVMGLVILSNPVIAAGTLGLAGLAMTAMVPYFIVNCYLAVRKMAAKDREDLKIQYRKGLPELTGTISEKINDILDMKYQVSDRRNTLEFPVFLPQKASFLNVSI